jgi:hypothetical protein
MTAVYLTIDTEYAAHLPGAGGGHASREENFARSIACATDRGAAGVFHQIDVLDANGLKGVFFVDPMPALVWGVAAIEDVVGPIVARGHDVQLHCHTEWLEHAPGNRLAGGRTGRHLKDFAFEDQLAILGYARATLMAAGAPAPVAFRAGNYGANDDTLAALARLGIAYDTSHSPALEAGACAISLGPEDRCPIEHRGVTEVPIGCIESFGGRLRHGQITALSLRELVAAVRHARDLDCDSLTLVSHSFELLSRDRRRINRVVAARFARFCAALAAMDGVTTVTYASAPPRVADPGAARPLPHDPLRSGARVIEQALANALYSRALRTGAKQAAVLGAALLS